MHALRPKASIVFAAILAFGLSQAVAQDATTGQPLGDSTYTPSVGQEGKDVVWVPTPQALVDQMLATAKLTPDDFLVDLGSGDGRTVISAGKLGTPAMGIEFNPDLAGLARRSAATQGVSHIVSFVNGDIFQTDFSRATVVTMFLLRDLNLKLRPKLLEMKPGTRLVSNTFDMGEWEADARISAGPTCKQYCSGYLWIVPAKVEGVWRLPQGQLALKQTFQKITGTMTVDQKEAPIADGRVYGETITFTAGGRPFAGRIQGNRILFSGDPTTNPTQATRQ